MSIVDELVIQDLGWENAALRARVADLESERDGERGTYRELAQAGIHALHDVVRERDRLRRENHQLRDDLRRYRLATGSQTVFDLPIERTLRPEDHRQQATTCDLHDAGFTTGVARGHQQVGTVPHLSESRGQAAA